MTIDNPDQIDYDDDDLEEQHDDEFQEDTDAEIRYRFPEYFRRELEFPNEATLRRDY